MKLNGDGSCRNNPNTSNGGVLVRDENGKLKGSYSAYFSIGTNNGTELKAILEEIQLCKTLSYYNVIIENDFNIVVDWFRKDKCTL